MLQIIMLILGLLLVALSHIFGLWLVGGEHYIFAGLVLVLGIPHGAADLLIAQQSALKRGSPLSIASFLARYLSMMLATGLLYFYFPLSATVVFVLAAAYHFGEADLIAIANGSVGSKLLTLAYGMVLLAVILLPHFDQVIVLLSYLPLSHTAISFLHLVGQHWLSLVGLIVLSFLLVSAFYYWHYQVSIQWQEAAAILFRLAVLVGILSQLSMLLGFTFYFVMWHSLLSLRNIYRYLSSSQHYDRWRFILQLLLFSSMAIAGILAVGYCTQSRVALDRLVIYIIVGLAVLTTPHLVVMNDMYKNFKKA